MRTDVAKEGPFGGRKSREAHTIRHCCFRLICIVDASDAGAWSFLFNATEQHRYLCASHGMLPYVLGYLGSISGMRCRSYSYVISNQLIRNVLVNHFE